MLNRWWVNIILGSNEKGHYKIFELRDWNNEIVLSDVAYNNDSYRIKKYEYIAKTMNTLASMVDIDLEAVLNSKEKNQDAKTN